MTRPLAFQALPITAWTATCAAGTGRDALFTALREGRSGLRPNDFNALPAPTHIGSIDELDGADAPHLPAELNQWDCRSHRLAWLALQQDGFLDAARAAVDRFGAHRVAVLVGTSTSSIGASEAAYRTLAPDGGFAPEWLRPQVHTLHSLGGFVSAATGAQGPSCTVATACSSSAKVFAQAERLIRCGVVDAAVVGGVDTLCDSVLYGFHALGLVASAPCQPFDAARQGISLAEAGGFALLMRPGALTASSDVLWLRGHGESSDAHHMSAPHPQGLGARLAITEALHCAGLPAHEIDYLHLHGTATRQNDQVEGEAVAALFQHDMPVSSTKGWTGHALGSAGILGAVVCLLALREGWAPGTLNLAVPDPALPAHFRAMLQARASTGRLRHTMCNAFGFGGNNASLVFSRDAGASA
jgi:3-oxoacyl-[acyl-carrier-protein] synthase-1